MNDNLRRLDQLEIQMRNWKLMEEAGSTRDPEMLERWDWGNCPLKKGEYATKFQRSVEGENLKEIIEQQLQPSEVRVWAQVPEDMAILLGFQEFTQNEIVVHKEQMGHCLILGKTGAGKTSLLAWLINQLLKRGIRVRFQCHKGDGRRLISLFPNAMVFRPSQECWNILSPVGPREMYWSALFFEIGKARNLHAETWPELVEIMKRIAAGLRPDEPYPSPVDFVRMLLILAKRENRPKLATAARAFQSLIAEWGRSAYIRKAPDINDRYPLIVHEYGNLPPGDHRLLASIRLLRLQMERMETGHSPNFQVAYISDEGSNEFGHEFSLGTGANYVPLHKRLMLEGRSFGIRVFVAAQMPSELDQSVMASASTFIMMQMDNPKEARVGQQLLMLPDQAANEIMSLDKGQLMMRFPGCSQAVRGYFPDPHLADYPSDSELAARMKEEFDWLEQHTVFAPVKQDDIRSLSYSETLDDTPRAVVEETPAGDQGVPKLFFAEHLCFLHEIDTHPSATVTEHYRNLGWSAGRGNRVKEQIIAMGLVHSESQSSANGRPPELLHLTEKGNRILNENIP